MLSLFPELLNFPMVGIFILRIGAAMYFLFLGERLMRTVRTMRGVAPVVRYGAMVFALCEIAVGTLLFVGLYTQGAALFGVVLILVSQFSGIGRGSHQSEQQALTLLLGVCLALLFLGAGIFAFDLPL